VKARSALIADLALVSTYTDRFEDAIAFTEMCPARTHARLGAAQRR
jgi:hypothetical protein